MKKLFALLFAAVITVSSVLTASAGTEMEQNAPEKINFDVQYKESSPKMDGVVNDGEYYTLKLPVEYFNYYYDSSAPDGQLDSMKAFVKNELKTYASWNQGYMYFAVTAPASKSDYVCNPNPIVYMFQHWCLQVAISDLNVSNADRAEIGIGANESTEKMLATTWALRGGSKKVSLKENEDYAVVWDRDNETVTYELRLKFSETLSEPATDGSSFRFSFLVGRGNGTASGTNQVQLGKGIAFEKEVYLYPIVTLKGAPSDIPEVTEPPVTEAPVDPTDPNVGMLDKCTDFRLPETMDMLDLKNDSMTAEYKVDDNADSYVRLTAKSDSPYIGGTDLTSSTNLDTVKTFAIRYRTTSEKAARLGVNLTSAVAPDLSSNAIVFPVYKLISDGEWHTMIFSMYDVPAWTQFATGFYLYPFDGETGVADETIDIMWIKFYSSDEIYFTDDTHEELLDGESSITPGTDEDTKAPEGDDTTKPAKDTAPVTTTDTSTSSGSSTVNIVPIIIGAVAGIAVIAAVIVVIIIVKKKKTN